ncbi:hypothetical protein [Mesorhizobium sp.]|uniref:hypothetical protein n=1 Tax=Mesorhizobium sp. TaxID=1871066 RepID=UPI0025C183C4|nr:hypothetical protein [Mesorhizobium sp.]
MITQPFDLLLFSALKSLVCLLTSIFGVHQLGQLSRTGRREEGLNDAGVDGIGWQMLA